MGRKDTTPAQSLFNMWGDDDILTLQTMIAKFPLLLDGANTGGTKIHYSGTGPVPGTIAGTYTLHGTYSFPARGEWAYALRTLNNNLTQDGTKGTLILNDIKLNGEVSLGTLGGITFKPLYGENLTLFGSLNFEYQINMAGTGAAYVGTFKIDSEVTGWKFRVLND